MVFMNVLKAACNRCKILHSSVSIISTHLVTTWPATTLPQTYIPRCYIPTDGIVLNWCVCERMQLVDNEPKYTKVCITFLHDTQHSIKHRPKKFYGFFSLLNFIEHHTTYIESDRKIAYVKKWNRKIDNKI